MKEANMAQGDKVTLEKVAELSIYGMAPKR